MIAKYNGYCKITGQKIVAGETEIVKVNGQWRCKDGQALTRSQRVQKAVFESEMAAPDWDDRFAEMQAEHDAYEAKKEAAVNSLYSQFPDVAPQQWRAAISNATTSMFPKPIKFTSSEKEAAFNKAIANL